MKQTLRDPRTVFSVSAGFQKALEVNFVTSQCEQQLGQCDSFKVGGILTVYTQGNADVQIKAVLLTLPLNMCLL